MPSIVDKTPEHQMIKQQMPDAPTAVRVTNRPPPTKSVKKLDFSSM